MEEWHHQMAYSFGKKIMRQLNVPRPYYTELKCGFQVSFKLTLYVKLGNRKTKEYSYKVSEHSMERPSLMTYRCIGAA